MNMEITIEISERTAALLWIQSRSTPPTESDLSCDASNCVWNETEKRYAAGDPRKPIDEILTLFRERLEDGKYE